MATNNTQSSNQLRSSTKFRKRPGTTGGLDGHFYEIDLLILGKLKGDRDKYKFYLASNMDGIGAFDDVVAKYWKTNIETESITIYLQAKHVKGKVTFEKFKNPKIDNGNFYIPKYFFDYLKIREQFDEESNDPIFKGNFKDLDLKFIIYTSAILDEKFDKDRIKIIEKDDVNDNIFSTKSKGEAFKLNAFEPKNSDLIEILEKVSFKEKITSLAKAIVECVIGKLNYNNMMAEGNIISKYHVFLSKNVFIVEKERSKGEKGTEYRKGEINYRFLETRSDDPLKEMLREEILYEYAQNAIFNRKANSQLGDKDKQIDLLRKFNDSLKSFGEVDYNIIRQLCGSVIILDKDNRKLFFSNPKESKDVELKNKVDELASYKFNITYKFIEQELKERLEKEPLKLHVDFGNIDHNVKKPVHLIKKLNHLFEQSVENVIKIDDSMVGHGKMLTDGDIKNIGKLIGSLLIFDQKEKMLKFVNDDSLSEDNTKFIKELKATAGHAVDDYRLDVKVKNFPRDSLVIEDQDRANVEEFFSKLEIFVGQASDAELKEIIKDEMRVLFKLTKDEAEESFLKIRDRAEKFWREGDEYLEKDDDFFPDLAKDLDIKFEIKPPIALFTGRNEMRKFLHEILQDTSSAIPRAASIAGLGGTGKSELVRKYVSEHSDDYCGNIIWINAENYQSLVASFFRLAKNKLKINVKCIDGEQKDIKSIVEEVYEFFAKRKCLFIFDNAEKLGMQNDDEGINKFLPFSSSNDNKPYILITSRNQKWGNRKVILLGSLTPEEAVELIKKALKINHGSQENEIQELADTLQYFPLALQQAVAYINNADEEIKTVDPEDGFKVDDYLQEYKNKTEELLDFPFPEDSDGMYAKTTFTTWATTVDKIAGLKESGEKSLEILNVMAYCVPYNIPTKMFSKLVEEEDARKLGAAVQLLKQYSMVDLEKGILSVHRLVQQVTRINLANKKKEESTLGSALGLFLDGSKQIDLFGNDLRVSNVDHAMSIWSYTNKHEKLVKEFSNLPTLIVCQLKADLRFDEAYSFGSNALKLLKGILGNNHISVLSLMNAVASILYVQGKDDESLKMYRELLKKSEIINRQTHRFYMKFEMKVGLILHRQRKYSEALEIFEKLKSESNTEEFQAGVEHNIGMVLSTIGRHYEAMEMFEAALAKKKRISDEKSILTTKNGISAALEAQGRYKAALELSWEVYEGRKEILGEKHPDTLTVYGNIALILKKLGKYEEALKISNEVDIKRKELLPNHPHTFKGILNTADILVFQGNYDEALEKVKEVYEKRDLCPVLILAIFSGWFRSALGLAQQRNYDKALEELYKIHEEKNILKPDDRNKIDTDGVISRVRQAQFCDINLHRAAQDGRLEEVIFLLNTGVTFNAIDNEYGVTPLHLAAHKGHLDVVNVLLNRGAEVNFKDKDDWMPVHYAAQGGHLSVIEALLNQGAEINVRTIDSGDTPLNLAIKKRNKGVVRVLQLTQYLFDVIDNKNLSEREKVIRLKNHIENGAISGAVNNGLTTLLLAIDRSNCIEIVDLLLKRGADATKVTPGKGNSVLHIAAVKDYNEIVELILKHARDLLGSTEFDNFVNTRTTSKGNAPLHIAAQYGSLKVVKSLLEYGATYNIKNKEGKTPIDLCQNVDTINLLKLAGKTFESSRTDDSALIDKLKELKL